MSHIHITHSHTWKSRIYQFSSLCYKNKLNKKKKEKFIKAKIKPKKCDIYEGGKKF